MSGKAIDLDEVLEAWAARYRLESDQKAAVRDAVLRQEAAFDVTSHHWWTEFIKTVMQNALRPAYLPYKFTVQSDVD